MNEQLLPKLKNVSLLPSLPAIALNVLELRRQTNVGVANGALGAEYDELLEKSQGNQIELVRLSREKFDLDHAQVGGMLAEHWKLPDILVEPIRQHHTLKDDNEPSQSLIAIVHVSVLCAQ